MTRVGYLGSIVIAFALGGIGMWAIQGNYKPLLRHAMALIETQHTQPNSQTPAPSAQVTRHPNALRAQQSTTPSQPHTPGTQSLFGNTPLAQTNPFKEMQRMQSRMNRFFSQNGFFGNGFFGNNGMSQSSNTGQGGFFNFGSGSMFGNIGSWFSNPTAGTGTSITEGQNSHSVYYKMKLGRNQNVSNVKVKVNNGYVSINARLQNRARNAFSASTVSEKFPVPAGVDANSAKITRQGDSIVIRFKKV